VLKKVDIALNHRQLQYNNSVYEHIISTQNDKHGLNNKFEHTKQTGSIETNKKRILPNILAGLSAGLMAASVIGLIPIVVSVVKNGGIKNAFNKFASKFDNLLRKKEQTNTLAKEFKQDLQDKMPNVYKDESEVIDSVDRLCHPIIADQSAARRSVSVVKGSWGGQFAEALRPDNSPSPAGTDEESAASASSGEEKAVEKKEEVEVEEWEEIDLGGDDQQEPSKKT